MRINNPSINLDLLLEKIWRLPSNKIVKFLETNSKFKLKKDNLSNYYFEIDYITKKEIIEFYYKLNDLD